MSTRQAIDTIKGYFYQFDYTIKSILELANDNDQITVEGVEDIDVKTTNEETAIQCKYYEKTEYNHSVIAKPIRLMLKDFKERKEEGKEDIKYKLYGYYKMGHEKLVLPITVEFLKSNFLTYTSCGTKMEYHISNNIENRELEEFISILSIDIQAKKYDEQMQEVLAYLSSIFECKSGEASFFYYNNCLRIIKDISTNNIIEERKISKQILLNTLRENKNHVFNEWYMAFVGRNEYFNLLKNEYFTGLNTSPFARFFLIEVPTKTYQRKEIKELILSIITKWAQTSKRDNPRFCPYILLFGVENKEFHELRNELYKEGIRINDGYCYAGSGFNPSEIIKPPNIEEKTLKWINKIDLLDTIFSSLETSTKLVFQFYINTPFFNNTRQEVNDINIQYESLSDIKQII